MGISTKKLSYRIEDGPNKKRIFDALDYALEKNIMIPIHFTILDEAARRPVEVKEIQLIGFKYDVDLKHIGTFTESEKNQLMLFGEMQVCPYETPDSEQAYERATFKASYNAYIRKGRIAITIHEKTQA